MFLLKSSQLVTERITLVLVIQLQFTTQGTCQMEPDLIPLETEINHLDLNLEPSR